jgi:Putative MetA-pathway of phenol degradation
MPSCVALCAEPRTLIALLALLLASEAFPQTDRPQTDMQTDRPQTDPRDAVIEDLRRRMETLEKRLEQKPAPPPPPAAPKPPPKPTASEQAGREDESARALERSLVREGGLVLPKGAVEVEPRLQYAYRGAQRPILVSVGGDAQVAEQNVRRDQLEASLGLRVGLPASFQAELRVPYVWVHEDRATSGLVNESERASGWGDVELGLSKQLVDERPGRPSLLASLNWKSVTGQHELNRLSTGIGFPQLQAAFTAVKRQDPLVFFGTASYSWNFERDRSGTEVDPGDSVGVRAGALLAASPETSLRVGFEISWFGRTYVAGSAVPGTDATVGLVELGVASLIGSRTLLDVNLGVGITSDAPDFRLRVALPIRF